MPNSTPIKVLIVEDEGDMCLLLNILLTGKGMQLDHVKTLANAGDYLQRSTPSVVILDNKLPDGLGMDYIPVLKKTHPALKVIGHDRTRRYRRWATEFRAQRVTIPTPH